MCGASSWVLRAEKYSSASNMRGQLRASRIPTEVTANLGFRKSMSVSLAKRNKQLSPPAQIAAPSEEILMSTYKIGRLILTPPRPEHEPDLFKLHNDPVIQKMIFKNVPQTAEDVRRWLKWFFAQWRKNGFGDWMVYENLSTGPIFIGRCGLRDYEDTNNLEIATAFVERATGRGLGLEVRRFAVTHALRNSSREKVVSFIRHGNAHAEGATKKLGLRYIEDRLYHGEFWQYYEMTREEYFSQPHHRDAS